MSDESLTFLRSELTRVAQERDKAVRESIDRKKAIRDLKLQLDTFAKEKAELTAARDTAVKERDDLDARVKATPDETAKELGRLKAELHGTKVAAKFDDIRGGLAEGVTLEHVFALNKFDAASADLEQLDPAELARGWQTAIPGLFKSPAQSSQAAPAGAQRQAPQLQVGTPAGRGAPDTSGSSFTVRRSDTVDAVWMQENQGKLAAAVAAGTVRWAD